MTDPAPLPRPIKASEMSVSFRPGASFGTWLIDEAQRSELSIGELVKRLAMACAAGFRFEQWPWLTELTDLAAEDGRDQPFHDAVSWARKIIEDEQPGGDRRLAPQQEDAILAGIVASTRAQRQAAEQRARRTPH